MGLGRRVGRSGPKTRSRMLRVGHEEASTSGWLGGGGSTRIRTRRRMRWSGDKEADVPGLGLVGGHAVLGTWSQKRWMRQAGDKETDVPGHGR